MGEARRRREREPDIARLKAWSLRYQQLVRALGEAFDAEDRDLEEMLEAECEKCTDEYRDILRSSLPEEQRAAFDEAIEATDKELETEMQRLDAEFKASIEEYRATGSKQRLLAYIAAVKAR